MTRWPLLILGSIFAALRYLDNLQTQLDHSFLMALQKEMHFIRTVSCKNCHLIVKKRTKMILDQQQFSNYFRWQRHLEESMITIVCTHCLAIRWYGGIWYACSDLFQCHQLSSLFDRPWVVMKFTFKSIFLQISMLIVINLFEVKFDEFRELYGEPS